MLLRDEAADRRMAETPSLLRYLPHILAYPLRGHGAPVLLFLAILLWFGMKSVLGIALFAIAAPWTFHYAEAVIEKSAHGRATPPIFGGDMIYLGGLMAFRPLIGVSLIAAAYTLTYDRGPGTSLLVLALGALFYPAFLVVLTVQNNVLAALNPLQLVPAMIAVGPAYFVICALLAGAAAIVLLAVNPAALFAALLITLYLLFVVFHMLGYVAFHNAAKLGLSLKVAPPSDASRALEAQAQRLAAVLQKIDAALHARDVEAAGKALYAEPGGPADLRLFHEELFEQMQARKNVELVHAQGARLITQLLREKRVARALDVAETCYDTHKDFSLDQPAQAVVLAEGALQGRRAGLFQRLTHDAPQRYAGEPAVAVSLAFLCAKDAYENGRDEARARLILAPLLAYTTHPQARQIAAYARVLGAATGPAPRQGQ